MWTPTLIAFVSLVPGTAPDSSAEPQLRALFESMGKLRNVHMMIVTNSREAAGEGFYPGNMAELWYEGPGKFRIQYDSYWGEAVHFVSDGRTLLYEPLSEYEPAVLKETKKAIFEADPQLAFKGGRVFPVYYMLAGRGQFDKLVDKKGFIKSVEGRDGMSGIQFQSPELGLTTVYFRPGKNALVEAIDYDDIPARKRLHEQYPQWVDAPSKDPLNQVDLFYISVGQTLPSSLFATTLPPGRAVNDTRKKRKP